MNSIGDELTTAQALELYEIWSNDDACRVFSQTQDGVLITLASRTTRNEPKKDSLASTIESP